MKKLFLASLLLASAGTTQADSPLVNADGSELSAICIAAVNSRAAMYDKAAELGVRDFNPAELRCNGQTVSHFIRAHRAAPAESLGYVFSKSDDTPVTELCMAALRSEQEYQRVKDRHFGDEENIEAEVQCNGMPLVSFVRKYRAPGPALSLR